MGEAPEVQKPAWVTVTGAILYTSWHAYLTASDKKVMTETVSEVNEEVINEVAAFARRVLGFDLRLSIVWRNTASIIIKLQTPPC
jgi:hypothetical protein